MAVERLKVISKHLRAPTIKTANSLIRNLTSGISIQPECGLIEDREFRYTINNSKLTREQRQFYEDNGYLVIPNLIDNHTLDECIQHFIDLCDGKHEKGFITLMKEKTLAKLGATGQHLYYKAQDILQDEIFYKYMAYSKMLDYVECFTGPNITAVHSMLINKPPDANTNTSRHPIHQDLYYFPFRPTDRIVGCWTAMETINENNGCLFVIPGTHKAEILYKHDYPESSVNAAFHGVLEYEGHPTVPLCMEKGDTVFLHPLLLHGSGINTTKGFRKSISCHYAASECYFIDVANTVQENIAKEIVNMAAKKGIIAGFNELWSMRSRVVRGIAGFTES